VAENDLACAFRDAFPVAPGHTLIIPKRHVIDYFAMSQEEVMACHELIHQQREAILGEDASVVAFNVGINAGEAAGQTVFHAHIHLIPRRAGDVAEPRGGIRHVIPGKGAY
jgi:diadenosine tetraphosphate (Ap4A) HIT family hydrolase